SAEHIRMQDEARRRAQREAEMRKRDQELSPSSQQASQAIHESLAELPTICTVTFAANAGAPGGRRRGGLEYNTTRGFAVRGRAQGGVGPVRLRVTRNSQGRTSTSVRVGGTYGLTLGFSNSNLTSIGVSRNFNPFLSAG